MRFLFRKRGSVVIAAGLATLLQITACTGPDPQFFFLSTAAQTTVAVLVARFVDLIVTGAAAA